jgi:hypothetical protein
MKSTDVRVACNVGNIFQQIGHQKMKRMQNVATGIGAEDAPITTTSSEK